MTMQLKTYNETLHDEFENLIDDLREKVMRNLKKTIKGKYHINYEINKIGGDYMEDTVIYKGKNFDVLINRMFGDNYSTKDTINIMLLQLFTTFPKYKKHPFIQIQRQYLAGYKPPPPRVYKRLEDGSKVLANPHLGPDLDTDDY